MVKGVIQVSWTAAKLTAYLLDDAGEHRSSKAFNLLLIVQFFPWPGFNGDRADLV